MFPWDPGILFYILLNGEQVDVHLNIPSYFLLLLIWLSRRLFPLSRREIPHIPRAPSVCLWPYFPEGCHIYPWLIFEMLLITNL